MLKLSGLLVWFILAWIVTLSFEFQTFFSSFFIFYNDSWKTLCIYLRIVGFGGVLKTPVTGVVTGEDEARRRRWSYHDPSSSLGLNLHRLIFLLFPERWSSV
jgi:hypothetical protein